MEAREISGAMNPVVQAAVRPQPAQAVSSAAAVASQSSSRQQSQPDVVVNLSTDRGEPVERHGVAVDNAKASENNTDTTQTATPLGSGFGMNNTNLEATYSVDEDRSVVIKITDKTDNQVVKEIPPQETRQIRKAVDRFIEQATRKAAQN